jgi:hypothetical protein
LYSPFSPPALADSGSLPGAVRARTDALISGSTGPCLRLLAFGIASITADRIDGLRQNPGPGPKQRISPVLLKYSDEQAVIGLAAVLDSVNRFGLQETDFTDWGVIAAPCRLGRPKAAGELTRFNQEGIGRVSPMLVPHLSLHALSGTISLALHSHGLNFGVSNVEDHLVEGLLTSVAILSRGKMPALWLVVTGWDRIPVPDETGHCCSGDEPRSACRGVALALTRGDTDQKGPLLRVHFASNERTADRPALTSSVCSSPHSIALLSGLIEFLTDGMRRSWVCPLAGGGWIELTESASAAARETRS